MDGSVVLSEYGVWRGEVVLENGERWGWGVAGGE